MAKLFDLWECSGYIAPVSIATELKDKERTIPLLQNMMETAMTPWNYAESALYHRIPGGYKYAMDSGVIASMLSALSQDPQYDFLRDDDRFQKIVEQARTIVSSDVSSIS